MINIVDVIIKLVIFIAVVVLIFILWSIGKKIYYRRKEILKRNQRYQSTRVLNKNADRQRKIGRKKEQKEFKLKRKTEQKEKKQKRKATKYTNATRRIKKNR